MRGYRMGFSVRGFVTILLALLPNIVWMLWPPAEDLLGSAAAPLWAEIMENVLRVAVMALLVFLVPQLRFSQRRRGWAVIPAALLLVGYYAFWVLYYLGIGNIWMLLGGLAAFPALYFMFSGVWLKNTPAAVVSVAFGIVHVASALLFR